MKNTLLVMQLVIGVLLSALILLQSKGVGLGRSMGGMYHSKRGMEIIVFRSTIILSVLFVIVSVGILFV